MVSLCNQGMCDPNGVGCDGLVLRGIGDRTCFSIGNRLPRFVRLDHGPLALVRSDTSGFRRRPVDAIPFWQFAWNQSEQLDLPVVDLVGCKSRSGGRDCLGICAEALADLCGRSCILSSDRMGGISIGHRSLWKHAVGNLPGSPEWCPSAVIFPSSQCQRDGEAVARGAAAN